MTTTDPDGWDAFVEACDPGSYLQLSGWAAVKAVNGWAAHRLMTPPASAATAGDGIAAQVLVRRPRPLPWAFAYAPRGPVADDLDPRVDRGLHRRRPPAAPAAGRPGLAPADRPGDRGSTARSTRTAPCARPCGPRAGDRRRRSSRTRPGSSTSRADEDALWGDLRKKWRQYVNKARSGGITVVDGGADRLGEFYRIYRETAERAGFLIRTEPAYRDVWNAFGPSGRARLLFAQAADGEPVATLFLVRCGSRVVEPYGGMTAAGAELRANYLLKWEAIRSSREAGRHELRPVGPGDGRDRPLQDRVRRARGPLRRRLGPGPRSARATRLRAGPGRAGPVGPPTARHRGWRQRRGVRAGGVKVRDATPDELADWDERTVEPAGGHVYQSRAWAAYRAASRLAAAVPGQRRRRASPGADPAVAGDRWRQRLPAARAGPRGRGDRPGVAWISPIARSRSRSGSPSTACDVVAADPEVPADHEPFRARITAAGFKPIEEIQPSRHRVTLPLASGADEAGVFAGDRQVDPPADPRRRARRHRRRPPRRRARGRGPRGRLLPHRRRRPRSRSTASTTCCSRRGSGAVHVRAALGVHGLVGRGASRPGTSSTSRPCGRGLRTRGGRWPG